MRTPKFSRIVYLSVTVLFLLTTIAFGQETTGLIVDQNGNVGIGDSSPDADLKLDVEGKVGATKYCNENGSNCVDADNLGGTSILAGWPDAIKCTRNSNPGYFTIFYLRMLYNAYVYYGGVGANSQFWIRYDYSNGNYKSGDGLSGDYNSCRVNINSVPQKILFTNK